MNRILNDVPYMYLVFDRPIFLFKSDWEIRLGSHSSWAQNWYISTVAVIYRNDTTVKNQWWYRLYTWIHLSDIKVFIMKHCHLSQKEKRTLLHKKCRTVEERR